MSTLNTTNLKNPSSGSNNIVLNTDGTTTVPTLSSTAITSTDITGTTIQGTIKSGTAVASTSGTAIDFTSIPSWVKRVTVMFSGVSTNGTSGYLIQLGDSGGIENTGYVSSGTRSGASSISTGSSTAGFYIRANAAADAHSGSFIITNLSSNTWSLHGSVATGAGNNVLTSAGAKTLSDTLDRIRITTENGTDTFDAGSVNILLEG
jgi:hypothetical protein